MKLIQDIDESKINSVDSKSIKRSWVTSEGDRKTFHGLIGVSLGVYKVENFKEKYEEILSSLFDKYKIPKEIRAYKSKEIFSIFSGRPFLSEEFIFEFSKRVIEIEELRINVFFTTLESKQLLDDCLKDKEEKTDNGCYDDIKTSKIISIYGKESSQEWVTVQDFLHKIEGYYPIICAWKLMDIAKFHNQNFLIDFSEGDESLAWYELIRYNVVNFIPRGDSSNCYISASDLILRAMDRGLDRWKKLLKEDELWEIIINITKGNKESLRKKINVIRIWNPDIYKIKPIRPKRIDVKYFVKHPIIFIFNEKNTKKEKIEIENSPLMNRLYERAYQLNGGVMFYESGISTKLIKNKDFFVYYGIEGEKTYKRLKSLGYDIIPEKIEYEMEK